MTLVDNFPTILPITIGEEGLKFVDNPKDPGGATKLGVTKATWEGWVGHLVDVSVIQNLTLADVTPLYRVRYWNAIGCPGMPIGLALCVFDFAVNSGDGRAAMELQKVLGVPVDGHIGPQSLSAIQKFMPAGRATLINNYQASRKRWDESLPTFPEFGDGWVNRVDYITEKALSLN